MITKWKCDKCRHRGGPCYMDEPIGMTPHICPYIKSNYPECIELREGSPKQPQPAPAPEPELMRCPFCGGNELVVQECYGFYVFCKTCYAYAGKDFEKSKAIAAWNRRPLPVHYPLDFVQAWDALGRGEVVEYAENTGKAWQIDPHINACHNGTYISHTTKSLHGKQFRIVEK